MNPQRFARLRCALERRQPDLTVLMDHVSKSHNFSAILRNCDATGVLEAHIVPPEKMLRNRLTLQHGISAGSRKWVSIHRQPDVRTAITELQGRGFRVVAAHPAESSVDYREIDFTVPTAIMMGAELFGCSEDGLRLADQHISIPMLGMVHSLNVSVASALLLFEAMRQRQDAGMYDSSRLSQEDFDRRLFEWAHPTLAHMRREAGRPYPALTPDGEIIRED